MTMTMTKGVGTDTGVYDSSSSSSRIPTMMATTLPKCLNKITDYLLVVRVLWYDTQRRCDEDENEDEEEVSHDTLGGENQKNKFTNNHFPPDYRFFVKP